MTETGFLKVVMDNPREKGSKCRGLVRLEDGVTVVPVYAEEKNGKFYSATPGFKGAKAVSLFITSRFGAYSTAHVPSMVGLIGKTAVEEIFGIDIEEKNEPFGYAAGITDKDIPLDKK